MECYDLTSKQGLWIAGPAFIRVEQGSLFVTGFTVNEGEDILVRDRRGITLYSLDKSKICVRKGEKGRILIVKEEYTLAEEWMKVIQTLKDTDSRKIVVVGPAESGKSTLTAWIYNALTLPVIESDIGQNELGVPTSVTFASYKDRIVALQDLQPDGLFFVGHVSADKVGNIVVSKLFKATKFFNKGFVIDTDGYIEGRGIFYKISLIEVVEPDAVIVLGSSMLYKTLKSVFASRLTIIFARPPPLVRERTRIDRRVFRQRLYTSLFNNTQLLFLENTPIVNICEFEYSTGIIRYNCFNARIIEGLKLRHASIAEEQYAPPRTSYIKPKWWKNLLVGLHLKNNTDSIGILENIRAQEKSIKMAVRTPTQFKVEPSEVQSVTLGWIRLNLHNMTEEHFEPGIYPEVLLRKVYINE